VAGLVIKFQRWLDCFSWAAEIWRIPMKSTLAILLSGLLLCGCWQKPASSARSAFDQVAAGGDTVWHGGWVLHVTKRDGAALEGIRITMTADDGHKATITADTGTLAPGSITNAADDNCVRILLHQAHAESIGETNRSEASMTWMSLVLQR
jgi:hypothetical protein